MRLMVMIELRGVVNDNLEWERNAQTPSWASHAAVVAAETHHVDEERHF